MELVGRHRNFTMARDNPPRLRPPLFGSVRGSLRRGNTPRHGYGHRTIRLINHLTLLRVHFTLIGKRPRIKCCSPSWYRHETSSRCCFVANVLVNSFFFFTAFNLNRFEDNNVLITDVHKLTNWAGKSFRSDKELH